MFPISSALNRRSIFANSTSSDRCETLIRNQPNSAKMRISRLVSRLVPYLDLLMTVCVNRTNLVMLWEFFGVISSWKRRGEYVSDHMIFFDLKVSCLSFFVEFFLEDWLSYYGESIHKGMYWKKSIINQTFWLRVVWYFLTEIWQ